MPTCFRNVFFFFIKFSKYIVDILTITLVLILFFHLFLSLFLLILFCFHVADDPPDMKPDLMMLEVKDELQEPVTTSSQTAAGTVMPVLIRSFLP